MKLKELRLQNQKEQSELAQFLSVTQSAISGWERGRTEPSLSQVKKIATFFQVSIDYLLGFEDDFGNKTYDAPIEKMSEETVDMQKIWKKLNFKNQCILLGRGLGLLDQQFKKNV